MAATKQNPRKPRAASQFKWRSGSYASIPASVAGPELERIAANDGGSIKHLKPGLVVDEARHPDAPLHPAFEWRDDVAAEKHREQQARALIRNIVTVEIAPTAPRAAQDFAIEIAPARRETLAWVHVNTPSVGHCYVPTENAMADPDLRRQALAEALSQLRGLRKRFAHLEELAGVFGALDDAERLIA